MTSQQLADELLHHWRNLWPLPPENASSGSMKSADLEFEEQL
jgi:hypothetical protein